MNNPRFSSQFNLFIRIILLNFLVFNFSANAQEGSSISLETSPSPTVSPAASPAAPMPILLSEVVTQAETTTKKLQEIQNNLSDSKSISQIQSGFAKLKTDLDESATETDQLLKQQPSLETLSKVEQNWKSFGSDLPDWKNTLKNQAATIDNQVRQINDLLAKWQLTLDSTSGVEIPPEIAARIASTISSIKQTQKKVEEKRAELLTLQNRVSEQDSRINQTLEKVSQVREEALTHLFIKDSPPIWSMRSGLNSFSGLVQETKNSIAEQFVALGEYSSRRSDRFVLHGILLAIIIGGLFWARQGVRPKVKEEPKLKQATVVFEYPVSTALILTILLSSWLYPQAPQILNSLLGAATLIPGVIILRQLIEKSIFSVLNALMVFYLVDRLREITTSLPVISRLLFLLEMLGAIIFLVWILRSKRLSNKIEVKHQRIFTIIKKIIPFALVVFTGALVANLLGFVSLARIVGNGVLGSAYIALILYAAIRIAESLLLFAVRVRPFSTLGMVKTHRRMLQDKILRVLRWAAIIVWGILTLNLFSIRESVFNFFNEILNAELKLRSFSISLADIITFIFTVWLAFVISRFIRFVLDEDVYPRVNLAGGVPYAISTIAHYIVLLIGFFLAVAALGVDLTKFTILAGAFGVGLGFGLQNIVNNFVSGLILLFERPVKVGDVIQLDDQQGDLKRIGLRASVIRTLQGSEVIVPNGQLISEQVINWTFSNQQRRLEINVGVAYGNNPREIIELLTKSVADHPEVLKEPPPGCIFVGFGDNSLDFQARAWTSQSGKWVSIKSDLAVLMHEALHNAEIEIPFPQRDLHLRHIDQKILSKIYGKAENEDEIKRVSTNSDGNQ